GATPQTDPSKGDKKPRNKSVKTNVAALAEASGAAFDKDMDVAAKANKERTKAPSGEKTNVKTKAAGPPQSSDTPSNEEATLAVMERETAQASKELSTGPSDDDMNETTKAAGPPQSSDTPSIIEADMTAKARGTGQGNKERLTEPSTRTVTEEMYVQAETPGPAQSSDESSDEESDMVAKVQRKVHVNKERLAEPSTEETTVQATQSSETLQLNDAELRLPIFQLLPPELLDSPTHTPETLNTAAGITKRKRLLRADELLALRNSPCSKPTAAKKMRVEGHWPTVELCPNHVLRSLESVVDDMRRTHPTFEPENNTPDGDHDDPAITATEFEFLKSIETRFVPLTDMTVLKPARTFKKMKNVMATRPVRREAVFRHLERLKQDGFLPTFHVVLYDDGQNAHSYGIVDGQHRIQAMLHLLKNPDLRRGKTFAHLKVSEDGIPLIPAQVLTPDNATPSTVMKFSLLLNKLYHHGNYKSVYYAICIMQKCMDWGAYKESVLNRTIESGDRRGGHAVQLFERCIKDIQDEGIGIPDAMVGISKDISNDLLRVVCRLHHFGVMEKLAISMVDPMLKKESPSMAITVWGRVMETMNNYYWFFRHCCRTKREPWRKEHVVGAMQLLMQMYLLSREGMLFEARDQYMANTWQAKVDMFLTGHVARLFCGEPANLVPLPSAGSSKKDYLSYRLDAMKKRAAKSKKSLKTMRQEREQREFQDHADSLVQDALRQQNQDRRQHDEDHTLSNR
ncbi:hypothetical protein DYB38_012622, partial [Aphanomyces astaci]